MNDYIHKEFPKTVGKTEFWKQIKRTVNGKEVSEEDIKKIVYQVKSSLLLNKNDVLLDLGCGNAALASRFFEDVEAYTGVDFSQYLLDVAKEYFQPSPNIKYVEGNITDVIKTANESGKYTKILIYGVMAYLSRDELYRLLEGIWSKYKNVERVFIGNIPNISKADAFYKNRDVESYDLDDPKSPIGVWWDEKELVSRCNNIGFKAKVLHMPDDYYGAVYRFDLLLTKE